MFLLVRPIMKNCLTALALSLVLISCKKDNAQYWVEESIEAYGFNALEETEIKFDFRNKAYSVLREDGQYVYRRTFPQGDSLIEDELANSVAFGRRINGKEVDVSSELAKKYSASINSVLYFFQLPYPLNDPAAIKRFVGYDEVKGEKYGMVEVSFLPENGGEDHQDRFVYWINEATYLIDYLAYSYETEGGGVRFRAVSKREKIEGMVFQNYINFEANKNSDLATLANAYEEGRLKQLSLIKNENISVRRN